VSEKLSVVAAIPNYNMAEGLASLIPQVLEQGYDEVYVLDDASTDDSITVAEAYKGELNLVRGRENVGAGANRNRIIDNIKDYKTIIHFIDADKSLDSPNNPDNARDVMPSYLRQGVGLVGGLVKRADGSIEPWNFGPVYSLNAFLTFQFALSLDRIKNRPQLAKTFQYLARVALKDWPDILKNPEPREVFWVMEGNMLIWSNIFKKLGGFDPKLHFGEIQDFAIRLEQKGIKRMFDPKFAVTHKHIDARGSQISSDTRDATLYMLRKYGIKQFVTGKVEAH
jgi:N-acetylglucosaminyl-diphospho-decaprenol L-rhamnosyltransferase